LSRQGLHLLAARLQRPLGGRRLRCPLRGRRLWRMARSAWSACPRVQRGRSTLKLCQPRNRQLSSWEGRRLIGVVAYRLAVHALPVRLLVGKTRVCAKVWWWRGAPQASTGDRPRVDHRCVCVGSMQLAARPPGRVSFRFLCSEKPPVMPLNRVPRPRLLRYGPCGPLACLLGDASGRSPLPGGPPARRPASAASGKDVMSTRLGGVE